MGSLAYPSRVQFRIQVLGTCQRLASSLASMISTALITDTQVTPTRPCFPIENLAHHRIGDWAVGVAYLDPRDATAKNVWGKAILAQGRPTIRPHPFLEIL